MNSVLYNFSLILLLIGLVLGTYYMTKLTYEKEIRIISDNNNGNIFDSFIYQERPNTLYKRMFNELGPWINRTANPTDQELSKEGVLRNTII